MAVHHQPLPVDANDRLKERQSSALWAGMIAATLVHFGVFTAWPELTAPDLSVTADILDVVELPPIDLPDAPPPLTRPAVPVMTTTELGEDLTIAPTTFESNPPDVLAPPPASEAVVTREGPPVTPFTVAPRLTNREEVVRAMERGYPPFLRDAGIGGRVDVFFHIDTDGRVTEARVHQSSGHAALDQAALDVAFTYEFSPALNRDQRVAVWVSIPVTFRSR